MFRHFLSTRGAIYGISAHSLNVRKFSYLSIHSVFPATLYRFQVYRESRLYDRTLAKNDRDYEEYEDGIEVASDGLVYPNISLDVSNGALFMPNTHLMQEITRGSYDNYLEAVDNGQPIAHPGYLQMLKGTRIPSDLTLYRERASRFSLQPSKPMPLAALNEILSEFYLNYGTTIPPDEWLENNPYHEAQFDDSDDWMGKLK
ncbi:hypothetical protein I7I53_09236 [Histoplasma capsulatum var. duboisii H88]|uniref:Tse2 ADP-ribosyltransferase toxin domain-containing protein n=1 Tax=Ajellomyces capsulatus (strain H88) TaxID=544711 RepID=A0A8A1L5U4_AJEC8|nr:hypothetical protein I7I53_09236 [Histoplasma capsulatum var. duboisii H88]